MFPRLHFWPSKAVKAVKTVAQTNQMYNVCYITLSNLLARYNNLRFVSMTPYSVLGCDIKLLLIKIVYVINGGYFSIFLLWICLIIYTHTKQGNLHRNIFRQRSLENVRNTNCRETRMSKRCANAWLYPRQGFTVISCQMIVPRIQKDFVFLCYAAFLFWFSI